MSIDILDVLCDFLNPRLSTIQNQKLQSSYRWIMVDFGWLDFNIVLLKNIKKLNEF
jgi:hypothetical protein